jgi:hypothetical protein
MDAAPLATSYRETSSKAGPIAFFSHPSSSFDSHVSDTLVALDHAETLVREARARKSKAKPSA